MWQDSLTYIYMFIYINLYTIYNLSTYSTSTHLHESAGSPRTSTQKQIQMDGGRDGEKEELGYLDLRKISFFYIAGDTEVGRERLGWEGADHILREKRGSHSHEWDL